MENLNDSSLADDVALLAQRRSDMESKLKYLAERLTINVNKTKSLDVTTYNLSNFTITVQAVEKASIFQYLGSQLTSDGGTNIHRGARIMKARAASLRNTYMEIQSD